VRKIKVQEDMSKRVEVWGSYMKFSLFLFFFLLLAIGGFFYLLTVYPWMPYAFNEISIT
jgi:NhaP-type Na+/H+ or K+/H+ antiporter